MHRVLLILAIVGMALGAVPVRAQTRVFVSGSGSDANPCSHTAPCRSFQQAHNTVLAGGEIVALDAAGYGPLNITKAVTVTAIGIEASITSNSTSPTAIAINAGASDAVTVRGLTLISGFTSGDGIDVNSAKSVTLRDCSVSGFPAAGIEIDPTANVNVDLQGVTSTNNGGGLVIAPSGSPAVSIIVTDSSFNASAGNGVYVFANASTGTINATLSLTAANNGSSGVVVESFPGQAVPTVMVTGSKIVNNGIGGLQAFLAAQVFVDRTQISGNHTVGWAATGAAVVDSYSNNAVNGNGNDGLNGVTQITSE